MREIPARDGVFFLLHFQLFLKGRRILEKSQIRPISRLSGQPNIGFIKLSIIQKKKKHLSMWNCNFLALLCLFIECFMKLTYSAHFWQLLSSLFLFSNTQIPTSCHTSQVGGNWSSSSSYFFKSCSKESLRFPPLPISTFFPFHPSFPLFFSPRKKNFLRRLVRTANCAARLEKKSQCGWENWSSNIVIFIFLVFCKLH